MLEGERLLILFQIISMFQFTVCHVGVMLLEVNWNQATFWYVEQYGAPLNVSPTKTCSRHGKFPIFSTSLGNLFETHDFTNFVISLSMEFIGSRGESGVFSSDQTHGFILSSWLPVVESRLAIVKNQKNAAWNHPHLVLKSLRSLGTKNPSWYGKKKD